MGQRCPPPPMRGSVAAQQEVVAKAAPVSLREDWELKQNRRQDKELSLSPERPGKRQRIRLQSRARSPLQLPPLTKLALDSHEPPELARQRDARWAQVLQSTIVDSTTTAKSGTSTRSSRRMPVESKAGRLWRGAKAAPPPSPALSQWGATPTATLQMSPLQSQHHLLDRHLQMPKRPKTPSPHRETPKWRCAPQVPGWKERATPIEQPEAEAAHTAAAAANPAHPEPAPPTWVLRVRQDAPTSLPEPATAGSPPVMEAMQKQAPEVTLGVTPRLGAAVSPFVLPHAAEVGVPAEAPSTAEMPAAEMSSALAASLEALAASRRPIPAPPVVPPAPTPTLQATNLHSAQQEILILQQIRQISDLNAEKNRLVRELERSRREVVGVRAANNRLSEFILRGGSIEAPLPRPSPPQLTESISPLIDMEDTSQPFPRRSS